MAAPEALEEWQSVAGNAAHSLQKDCNAGARRLRTVNHRPSFHSIFHRLSFEIESNTVLFPMARFACLIPAANSFRSVSGM